MRRLLGQDSARNDETRIRCFGEALFWKFEQETVPIHIREDLCFDISFAALNLTRIL